MPVCKNCGARISKLNNDICPVCGTRNPLQGVSSETVEITSQLDANSLEYKNYRPISRMVAFILSALIGFSGAALFYMRYFKLAIIHLSINIILFVGMFLLIFFVGQLSPFLSIFIPLAILYAINILLGLFILLKNDLKDGRGEFLK